MNLGARLFVLGVSEDGDFDFVEANEAALLRRIEESGPPCTDHYPSMDGNKHNGPGPCWIIIRGLIVRPEPITTVTAWRLP